MYVDDLRIVAPRVLRSAQLPAWLPGGPVLDERSHERRRNTEHECSFPRGSQYMLYPLHSAFTEKFNRQVQVQDTERVIPSLAARR